LILSQDSEGEVLCSPHLTRLKEEGSAASSSSPFHFSPPTLVHGSARREGECGSARREGECGSAGREGECGCAGREGESGSARREGESGSARREGECGIPFIVYYAYIAI
jgi:hypothetical protein